MRLVALAAVAVVSLSACAGTSRMTIVENGYEPGALGASAISRSDWRVAEVNLNAMRGVKADDPARLLNLGTVYMQTGRPTEALAAWQAALASKHPYQVDTVDGRTVSTDQLAREALARYQTASR